MRVPLKYLGVGALTALLAICAAEVFGAPQTGRDSKPANETAQRIINILPSRKFEVEPLALEVSKVDCDLRQAIGEGFMHLASVSLDMGPKDLPYSEVRGSRRVNMPEPEHEIALYVLNPADCSTDTVVITKQAGKLISPEGWSIDIVKRSNGIRWNYWNTEYVIASPVGWIVVANNYPFEDVVSKTEKVRDKRGRLVTRTVTTTAVKYALYSPYSEALRVSDLILNGQYFLGATAKRAKDELRAAGVVSRAFRDRLVADVPMFKDEVFVRLALMEHSDWTEFRALPEWTTERLLATIGANEERFAANTCNRKSACGIMQFTNMNGDGTYDMIVEKYPSAGLDPEFSTGAADPLNAMKAAILLHDNNLKALTDAYGPSIAQDGRIEEFLAALYNASWKSVTRSLTPALKGKKAEWTGKLLTETKGYIAKLRWLRDVYFEPTVVAENKAVL